MFSASNPLTEAELDELEALGLPSSMRETLRQLPGVSAFASALLTIGFVLVMIALIFPPIILCYGPWMSGFLQEKGIIPEDAILAELNFVAPVIFVFAGIFAAGLVMTLPLLLVPGWARRFAVTTMRQTVDRSQKHAWANRAMLRWILRRMNPRLPPRYFLAAVWSASLWLYAVAGILLYGIGILFLCWDISSMTVVTPDGIQAGRYFTFQRDNYAWDDAEKITTGCNPKGKSRDLHYRVHFPEDRSFNLASKNFDTLQEIENLEALDTVDSLLRERGVPWEAGAFVGGLYDGDTLWYPACFEWHRLKLSPEDRERFDRVFRTGTANDAS